MKKYISVLIAIMLSISSIGCSDSGKSATPKSVKIAQQYGIAYAPIEIMKEKGFLENELEGYSVEWVKLGNTASIREAAISGNIDVAFMGIPPFLISIDNGMDWKLFSGLSKAPLGLVSNDERIKNLSDFNQEDKIALPQPGSIQHILLSMACEKELSNANALDNNLVTLNHPDGMSALMSKESVKAHFTSPPFVFQELEDEGNHLVISGAQAMGGEFTFIAAAATKQFYEGDSAAYKALKAALSKSIDYMNSNRDKSAKILSKAYGISPEKLSEYLSHEEMEYSQEIDGIEKFSDFMKRSGYIKSSYSKQEVMWPEHAE